MLKLLSPLVIGAVVTGCATDIRKDYMPAYNDYATNMYAAHSAAEMGSYYAARGALVRAVEALPEDRAVRNEAGFHYDIAYGRSALAWVDMADGELASAANGFQATIHYLQEQEFERERTNQKKMEKGQIVDGFFQGLGAFANSLNMGEDQTMATLRGLESFTMTTLEEVAPPLSGKLFEDYVEGDGWRAIVIPAMGPLTLIGHLVGRESRCTASLVGYRLALTNAHCVTDWRARSSDRPQKGVHSWKGPGDSIAFRGLYQPDKVNVVDAFLHEGKQWRLDYNGDYRSDWALLELDRHPTGRGWFGVADEGALPAPGDKVYISGHSGELNDGRYMALDWRCSRSNDSKELIEHTCKALPGTSGTPIIAASDNGSLYTIVGVNAYMHNHIVGGGGPTSLAFYDEVKEHRARIPEPLTLDIVQR